MFKRYRKNLRNNRALSTRRIFNNKSAKSQAKQIYALRKSINSVRQMCKPEVKVNRSQTYHDVIGLNNIYVGTTISNYKMYSIPLPLVGTGDENRIGNVINLLPLKFNFSSQYKKIINSVSTPIATRLLNSSGGVRMIVLQTKAAVDNPPDLVDILNETPTSLNDSVAILNTPFKNGITARYHILQNKLIYYSENQLIKCMNLKIRPVIKKVQWESGYVYPIGQIWVFLVAGGFSFVDVGSGDNPYDYDVCDYSLKMEIPYSDA